MFGPNMPRILRGVAEFDLPPIELSRAGTVTGVVVDDRGEPVPGAAVLASYPVDEGPQAKGQQERHAIAGRRGEFRIPGVVAGVPWSCRRSRPTDGGRRDRSSRERGPIRPGWCSHRPAPSRWPAGSSTPRAVASPREGPHPRAGARLRGRSSRGTAGRDPRGLHDQDRARTAGSAPRRSSTRIGYTPRWPRPTATSWRGPSGPRARPGCSPSWCCIPGPSRAWSPSRARSLTARAGRSRTWPSGSRPTRARPIRTASDVLGRFRLEGVPPRRSFLFAEAEGFRFFGRLLDPARRIGLDRADAARRAADGPDEDAAAPSPEGRGTRAVCAG